MNDETESFAERGQIVDLSDSLVPKGKMLSDKNLFESESFGKEPAQRISLGKVTQILE